MKLSVTVDSIFWGDKRHLVVTDQILLGTHTQLPIGVDTRNLLGVPLLQHCGCESHLWKHKDESDVTVHVVAYLHSVWSNMACSKKSEVNRWICMALYYKPFISKALRYVPCVTMGSHSFTHHPQTYHTCLYAQTEVWGRREEMKEWKGRGAEDG